MKTATIKGITYNVQSEVELTGKAKGFYVSLISLVRPNGNKEFYAMRDFNGNITLN